VAGLRLEPLGAVWAAFSPASGETQLLNDESAALLEWLLEAKVPGDADAAARVFASDTGLDVATLRLRIEQAWPVLVESGLVRSGER